MNKTCKVVAIGLFSFLFLFSTLVFALDIDPTEIYEAPGLHPHRETLSSISNEHIDPFTGGLVLTFEDIRLPGNGGLDLVIQRTFNSKNTCNEYTEWLGNWSCSREDENTWLGFGWTLHFGRLFKSTNVNRAHVIEMPDGSRHTAYKKINSSYYITRDYWLLDINPNPPVLILTNGTRIFYGQSGPPHPDFTTHIVQYATKIQDINGNEINIYYKSYGSNEISYVIDTVGRRIDFTTATINYATRLVSISGPGVSIAYTHTPHPVTYGKTFLTEAKPPVGNPWQYYYNQSTYDLKQVTTPSGGVINYSYGLASIDRGSYLPFYIWAVIQKSSAGSVPVGTWSIKFSQGLKKDYTEVIDPCGRTHRYRYHGYGEEVPYGSMWKIGLPKSREIVGEETVVYQWTNSTPISYDDYVVLYLGRDYDIYVPLLSQRAVTRDGKTYLTNYSNYDIYGNPQTISEAGDKVRNRNLTYWYETSKNLVHNRPSSEAVSGGFPGTFTTYYSYDTNGNLCQINKYGVTTDYTYYSNGNLRTRKDANGNTVTYEWSNGRISKEVNPIYSITRMINPNGTIASETNGRGYTTSFTYDGNLRLTKITPPVGNPTNFSYPTDNSYKKESRGQYYIYYYNDGFGRPTGSLDIKGIDVDIVYKACGPKNYTTSNIGDTVYFDHFGRVKKITHKDNKSITYAYSQSNVTVTDEALSKTYFTYNAFGNPDEKWLMSVKDALNNTTTYNYNILGSLTHITQGSLLRTFTYNSKNFLTSETHPEKGTISYGRDNVGNITSKTDGLGTISYGYDALYRLRTINSNGQTITFSYDNSDNRIGMSNIYSTLTYTYDGSNRLTQKSANILGRVYNTYYGYDGNDNLTDIYYPSGEHITYVFNNKNQVTSVTGSGFSVSNITYYTSGTSIGLPKSFTHSNALTTNLTYTPRNLIKDTDVSGSVLDLVYSYDTRGNMTSIKNNLDPSKNQTFTYDKLNRLMSFNGPWGTGSYTYDALGNRLKKVVKGIATTYNYTGNRLSSTTGGEPFSFSYNSTGDAIYMKEAGLEYDLEYDWFHNLIGFRNRGVGVLATFTYDGDGMRLTKTSNGRTVVYHYDKEGRVISETDSSGNLISDYIYLNGKLVGRIEPTAKYFYHTDPAGTPLVMTDVSGKVVWRADYKPFGEEYLIAASRENDLRFVGKEKDRETGLLYFGARYMESLIGRFLSPDPAPITSRDLINPQRLNKYTYGLNNPYRYMDPDGRLSIEIHRQITMDVFTRKGFSERASSRVAEGNVSVDLINPWDNYMHSMSNSFQRKKEAIIASETFVRERLREAGRLIASGDYERGLFELGRGLHTVQDRVVHNFITLPRHAFPDALWRDSSPTVAQRREAERATEKYLEDFWSVLRDDQKLSERQIEGIKKELEKF